MPNFSKEQEENNQPVSDTDTSFAFPDKSDESEETTAEVLSDDVLIEASEAAELPKSETDSENENKENEPAEPVAEEPSAGVKALSFAFDLTEMFAISFAVVIVALCFFLRHSPVSGASMEPTIQNLDTLLVSNIAYTPERGDVVIVQSTHNLQKPLVKRVIAVGGDEIQINFDRWMIMINGEIVEQRFDENGNYAVIGSEYVNYIEGQPMRLGSIDGSDLYKTGFTYDTATGNYIATVPEGRLFILGDNRNDSKDSRDATVGFVDVRLVVGKAIFRLTPFSNMGTLDK